MIHRSPSRPRPLRCTAALAAALLCIGGGVLTGCAGSGEAKKPPDQRYGHRYPAHSPERRRTLTIEPSDPSQRYFTYAAPVSEVIVRAASSENGEAAVPVELLLKGGLPNDCLALHEARQDRNAHLLHVKLIMRKPRGAASCARYERPFRFYLPLKGRYEPGDYQLTVNGTSYPFTIRRKE